MEVESRVDHTLQLRSMMAKGSQMSSSWKIYVWRALNLRYRSLKFVEHSATHLSVAHFSV